MAVIDIMIECFAKRDLFWLNPPRGKYNAFHGVLYGLFEFYIRNTDFFIVVLYQGDCNYIIYANFRNFVPNFLNYYLQNIIFVEVPRYTIQK